MKFIEKLSTVDALRCLISREPAFVGIKSFGARVVEKLAVRLGRNLPVVQIAFGNVTYTTGIREGAYRAAERAVNRLSGERWASMLGESLNVDLWLITRKFFFDKYYLKFEFIELALRYLEENPGETPLLITNISLDATIERKLASRFILRLRRDKSALGLSAVLLLPLFVELFYLIRGNSKALNVTDSVICEVDGPETYDMFSTLFANIPADRLVFVSESRNVGALPGQAVHKLGLGVAGRTYLRRAAWKYLGASLANAIEISCYGVDALKIFYTLMRGRAETIEGSGNLYCTFEHLVTYKAARNSFIESQGSCTMFVPFNSYVTPQYLHSEILANYTVMCAAGRHTEILCRKNSSLIKHYLPTGSYASHRRGSLKDDKTQRIAALADFKGQAICVVIVSPGICDPTYAHELKLMAFARKLASMPDIKVMLRLKPVELEPKYADFYLREIEECSNILVTSGEYDLFDFLTVGDIFLTSISTAACDLAQAGALVMFIDFMRDPSLMLPWSAVPEVLLEEKEALPKVLGWVSDEPGQRALWRETMQHFVEHIAYNHNDFRSYQENFMRHVIPFLPAGLTLTNKDQDI